MFSSNRNARVGKVTTFAKNYLLTTAITTASGAALGAFVSLCLTPFCTMDSLRFIREVNAVNPQLFRFSAFNYCMQEVTNMWSTNIQVGLFVGSLPITYPAYQLLSFAQNNPTISRNIHRLFHQPKAANQPTISEVSSSNRPGK